MNQQSNSLKFESLRRISLFLILATVCVTVGVIIPQPNDLAPSDMVSSEIIASTVVPQPTAMVEMPSATPTAVSTPKAELPRGNIVASVYRNWNWDIYVLSPDGDLLKRLTFGEGDNRAPSWSPDGSQIAFESNRNRNWDIYVMNADGTNLRRLTSNPHFDGSPRWSPDGHRIAFTSDSAGDLDVWVMSSDGSSLVNLTPNSPSIDYDPAWSPDGTQIAFASARENSKAIYVVDTDGSKLRRLSPAGGANEEQPAWSPDGKQIAYTSEQNGAREIHVAAVSSPQSVRRVTALENDQWPAWLAGGTSLIYVNQNEEGQWLEQVQIGMAPRRLTGNGVLIRQPDWNAHASVTLDVGSLQRADDPLYVEKTSPNPPDRLDRYNLVRLNNVRVIVPLLGDTVDDSYYAVRQRILDASGWDFFSSLSESVRPLLFKSLESDFLSWHKAGRAIDTLQAYVTSQGQILEVVREDILGDTYWRLYLRAANQDGTEGEPLRGYAWDISDIARARSRGKGGLIKGILPGYYVDLTEILRQYGWKRIASHTEPDFDWHNNYTALEFWHYQKTDGLTWWQAIHEVYTPQELGDQFNYALLLKAKYDVSTIIQKGIPIPNDVMQKYTRFNP